MPIEALTRRINDASTQTDYLAKTAGQAYVVCNEPDGCNEILLTDRLKQLVSDSDKLSVRKMFGEQEDIHCKSYAIFLRFAMQSCPSLTKQFFFATHLLVCRLSTPQSKNDCNLSQFFLLLKTNPKSLLWKRNVSRIVVF